MKGYCSLATIRFGNWYVKASILDDQIMIIGTNVNSYLSFTKIFYDERDAKRFMDSLRKGTVEVK